MITKRSNKHYIWGGIGILIVAIITASVISLILLRDREIESWRHQLSDMSLLLSEETYQSMASAQLAMDSIVDNINAMKIRNSTELTSKLRTQAIHRSLRDKIAELPQVDVATIVAANGDIISFSRSFPPPAINLSDRDYFQARRDDSASGTFVSLPVINRGNGKRVFYLSTRINDGSGRFMGLVLVGISVDQLTAFYERLGTGLGKGAAITLLRRDFSVIARWPYVEGMFIKRNLTGATHHVIEELKKNDDVVYTSAPRLFDSNMPTPRLVAIRLVPKFPLIMNITVTEEYFLESWRRTAISIMMIAGGSILALVLAALYMTRLNDSRSERSI